MTTPTMPQPVNPDLFLAERDTSLRRGGGMEEERPVLAFADIERVTARSDGAGQIRKFAIVMRAPGREGPGTGQVELMPAEKWLKWWGQGYRPEGWVDPGPPPPPSRWLPSMIEDAIAAGLPIPEEMKPVGYYGPTFKIGAWVDPLAGDEPSGRTPAPTVFYCPSPGCTRFFDSQDGVNAHSRSHASQGAPDAPPSDE